MTLQLPPVLSDYYAAKNRHDIDAMMRPFAPDATVRDEGGTYHGHDAIRGWMEETTRKYRVTVAVQDAEVAGDNVRVAALVSGNFPGSPAVLGYAFTLRDGKIAGLAIG